MIYTFALIFLMLAAPYIIGSALITIFGDRRHRGPVRWIVGVLFLIPCFLLCLVLALKMDFTLDELCKSFEIATEAVLAGAVPVFIYAVKNKRLTYQNVNKKIILWAVPAVALGVFSVFFINPVYVNDITVETVRTTLYTGRIYDYSAVLGTKMEAGLPIFNKLEIMPMLYAVLCRCFHVDVEVLTTYIVPLLVYASNIFLMWEISKYLVKEEHRSVFMIFHLFMLLAGTYLPMTAIPVTVGQPLLMQGYSGWAVAYGMVIPCFILMLMDKRFILAAGMLSGIVGLIRYDRIYFACKDFVNGYHLSNTAGKLWLLYLLAFVWWHFRRRNKKTSQHPAALLSGSALVSATLTDAYVKIGEKKSFVAACCFVMLSCCYFVPFEGATLSLTENDKAPDFEIVAGTGRNVTLWAPEDVMSVTRRNTAAVKTIYGRDYYEKLLDGVNYEPVSEEQKELCYAMSIIDLYMDEYVESLIVPIISQNDALSSVDVVMLPMNNYSEKIEAALAKRGFSYSEKYDEYLIMRRYE